MGGNREKSNIAIAILEKLPFCILVVAMIFPLTVAKYRFLVAWNDIKMKYSNTVFMFT